MKTFNEFDKLNEAEYSLDLAKDMILKAGTRIGLKISRKDILTSADGEPNSFIFTYTYNSSWPKIGIKTLWDFQTLLGGHLSISPSLQYMTFHWIIN